MQKRAREEAIKVLGDDEDDVIPTIEQSRDMPYINMIIKEVGLVCAITRSTG